MKSLACNLSAVTILFTSGHGAADVIYSGFQNLTIPATYAGTYIDVDGGLAPSTSTFAGWDFNPFMGGVYLSNNASFQPARDGTGGMDTALNFGTATTISAAGLNFAATGSGGSMDHLGTQFTAGGGVADEYLGFELGANYGWMRVVFTNNAAGAKVLDWAYDTSGSSGAIATGNILSDGSTVTLDSTFGSFTLGSAITGGSNSVVKTGAGTVTLAGSNDYSGTTAVNVGTLLVNNTSGSGTGSGAVTVTGGILGGTGSIAGAVTLNGGTLAPGASIESLTTGELTMNAGTTFAYEMNSTVGAYAADLLVVTGGVTLNGTVQLGLTDVLGGAATRFADGTILTLINYASSLSGGFFYGETPTLLNEGDTFTAGLNTWKINYSAASGGLNALGLSSGSFINLTAIPEPGSWLALGCLVSSGMMLRSRRQQPQNT